MFGVPQYLEFIFTLLNYEVHPKLNRQERISRTFTRPPRQIEHSDLESCCFFDNFPILTSATNLDESIIFNFTNPLNYTIGNEICQECFDFVTFLNNEYWIYNCKLKINPTIKPGEIYDMILITYLKSKTHFVGIIWDFKNKYYLPIIVGGRIVFIKVDLLQSGKAVIFGNLSKVKTLADLNFNKNKFDLVIIQAAMIKLGTTLNGPKYSLLDNLLP